MATEEGSEPPEEPRIFKPPAKTPREIRCMHGYDHHEGPHACDMDKHGGKCPWWRMVKGAGVR